MGAALAQLGMQTASQAIGAGMGMILGEYNDKRQLRQQERLQKLQIEGQKEMSDYNLKRQMNMWEMTNYKAQVEQLKKAGLNPALMYGMSGGGGTTANASPGNVSGASAPQGGGEIQQMIGMGLQNAAQLRLINAQAENIEADTKNKSAGTENIQADTENKILQKVITEFTGKEAKDTYEKIKSPNRSIEAKTYEDELAARQGVAGTIYDLWVSGQLEQKSMAEIEEILLRNAKTRQETKNIHRTIDLIEENIKGAKLDNIIKELESKLQTETGIDRNSPAWLKILGRLFVQLTSK